MTFSTAFDEAIALTVHNDSSTFTAHTTAAYQNMIGPFGGITAAVLLQAVLSRNDIIGQPLSLTIHYIHVVAEGEYTIVTELIGSSKTTQHFSIKALQNGTIVLQALALCGTLRPQSRFAEISFPVTDKPDMWEKEDLLMPWSKNFDFRFVKGGLKQLSDTKDTQSLMWVRNDPPRPIDFSELAAIADSFIPRIIMVYKQMVPVGTVTLTTYFHASLDILSTVGDDFVLAQAQGMNFGEGWYDQIGHIWSATGTLLATTTQMVYFKAPQV